MEVVFSTEELKNIGTWMLLTNDAHKLYHQVGFMEFPYPERVMIKKSDG